MVEIMKWLHNLSVGHQIIHLQLPIYHDPIAEVHVTIPDDLRMIIPFALVGDSMVKIMKWLHNLYVDHRIIHLRLLIYHDPIAEVRMTIRFT